MTGTEYFQDKLDFADHVHIPREMTKLIFELSQPCSEEETMKSSDDTLENNISAHTEDTEEYSSSFRRKHMLAFLNFFNIDHMSLFSLLYKFSLPKKSSHMQSRRIIYQRKFSCPESLDFQSKSEICDPEAERTVRDRSVDSDDGAVSPESVIDTLDKLNVINANVEKKKNKNKIKRKCYGGPANLLVGASSRYFKDFRRDDAYRKKIIALIEQKILTSTKYARLRKNYSTLIDSK